MKVSTLSFRRSLTFVVTVALLPWLAEAQTIPKSRTKSLPDFAIKTAEYMRTRVRVSGFSGAVLVARGGKVIFRQSYGLANHEFGIPNTPTTKFRAGSAGKQFTAAAILLLEQRGKLKVSDNVHTYLPDWPKAWRDVTIHHLLSHTAGLPRLTTQALLDVSALSRSTPKPFREVGDLFKPGEELQPPDFKPGEGWAYSNVGYVVLGLIIDKVSGKTYCDFFSEEIFRPLGMINTSCEDPDLIVKNRASGYTRVDSALTNASYVDLRMLKGTGTFYTTIDDLMLWDRTLNSDRLLSNSSREKLFTPVRNEYAYGWWVQTKANHKVLWHGGNVSGFVSHIARYPENQLFIAILSNVWSNPDRSQVRAMATELAAIAFGESYELPRKHLRTADALNYEPYVGEYRGKDIFAIAREGERLMFQFPPGQSVFEIVPESATQFFWQGREFYLTFVKDDNGKVTHVVVSNEGEIGRWTKSR